ncbi:MAG: hypothetical protein JWN40_4444 [Phycisphaerales bacterium]|jgi:hypothetical protein|nr:hypothetical protein [Phycisphaerales bacterium]
MFKLLRLAVYGLVGYAAYQFVMDVVNAEEQQAPSRGKGSRGGGGGGRQQITGARRGGGAGKAEATHDSDGGSVRHRVGRGVV